MKKNKFVFSKHQQLLSLVFYGIIFSVFFMLSTKKGQAQDGVLDPSFGNGGSQIFALTSAIDYSKDIAIQTDGKIVLAGKIQQNSLDFSIVRYEADGSGKDVNFGNSGIVTIDINNANVFDEAEAVAIQTDGKIVVAGRSKSEGALKFTVLRLLTDGTLDNTFNGNGIVSTSMDGSDIVRDMLIQPDGKILVAGGGQRTLVSNSKAYAIARYLPNGDLDEDIPGGTFGFSGDGRLITSIMNSSEDEIRGIVLDDTNGNIIAAGNSKINSKKDFSFAIFDEDGNKLQENSWDISANGRDDEVWDVARQADGKIIIAGWTDDGISRNAAVIRLLSDGTLDPDFGTGGIVTQDFGQEKDDEWRSISLLPSGQIVLSGLKGISGGSTDILLAKYSEDGVLVNSFGTNSGSTCTDLDNGSDDEPLQNNVLISQGDLNYRLLLTGIVNNHGNSSDDNFIAAYSIEDCLEVDLPVLGSAIEDSLALVDLYHNTYGDYWCDNTNWLTAAPLEEWYGITTKRLCETGERRVIEVNLEANNLRGTIAASIDALYYLEDLMLGNNRIQNMEAIFQTSPWSPQIDYYLPTTVDVNNNALPYPDLIDNRCWLPLIGVYQEQHLDTMTLYRGPNNSSPDSIPHRPWNEEPMLYMDDYNNLEFRWYFDGTQLIADERAYSPQPYGSEQMFHVFSRQTTFPSQMLSHCGLGEVNIYAHFDLVIWEITGSGLGVHVPNQFIIKYDLDIDPDSLAAYERLLSDTLGATLLKECPCGPNIQLWAVDLEEIELEVVRCSASSKAEVDTTEFNFLFSHRKQQAFSQLPSIPDTSYLNFNPMSSSENPIIVGVSDSGVEQNNNFVSPYLWHNGEANDTDNCVVEDEIGYDFRNYQGHPQDFNDHGTAVTGIIGRNYSVGEIGIMNTKFYEGNYGQLFDAVCGMHYAMDNGAKILNMSWGYYSDTVSIVLEDAIARAQDEDILVVTSSGNGDPFQGDSLSNDIVQKWPANFMRDYDNVIVVGSYHVVNVEGMDTITYPPYANFGIETVHLAAPGHTCSANIEGGLSEFQGTSVATPFVSRTAAVLMQEFPHLSMLQVKDCILSSVTQLPVFANRVITSGMLNFEAARACAASTLAVEWIDVKAQLTEDKHVLLEWQVQEDEQHDYYEIWKSQKGDHWNVIGSLTTAGHSTQINQYTYWDKHPFLGNNYYKIKQIDRHGKADFSKTIQVNVPGFSEDIRLFPNPTVQHTFNIQGSMEEPAELRIFNLQGQLVYRQNLTTAKTQIQLPASLSGMFMLVIANETQKYQQKIVVE